VVKSFSHYLTSIIKTAPALPGISDNAPSRGRAAALTPATQSRNGFRLAPHRLPNGTVGLIVPQYCARAHARNPA